MTGDVHDRHDRQLILTTPTRPTLRSQRLRLINHQGDALRLGMNWTEEDLGKPQVLVDSVYGMGHPGTFHFRELIEEVSNRVPYSCS